MFAKYMCLKYIKPAAGEIFFKLQGILLKILILGVTEDFPKLIKKRTPLKSGWGDAPPPVNIEVIYRGYINVVSFLSRYYTVKYFFRVRKSHPRKSRF